MYISFSLRVSHSFYPFVLCEWHILLSQCSQFHVATSRVTVPLFCGSSMILIFALAGETSRFLPRIFCPLGATDWIRDEPVCFSNRRFLVSFACQRRVEMFEYVSMLYQLWDLSFVAHVFLKVVAAAVSCDSTCTGSLPFSGDMNCKGLGYERVSPYSPDP